MIDYLRIIEVCWQLHKYGWHEWRDIIGESLHKGAKSKDPTANRIFNQFPVVKDGKTHCNKFFKTFQILKNGKEKKTCGEWDCPQCLMPRLSLTALLLLSSHFLCGTFAQSWSPGSLFRHSLNLKSIFKPCHPGPDPLPQVCQQLVNSVTSDKARMNQTSQDFGRLLPYRDVWVLWKVILSGVCQKKDTKEQKYTKEDCYQKPFGSMPHI